MNLSPEMMPSMTQRPDECWEDNADVVLDFFGWFLVFVIGSVPALMLWYAICDVYKMIFG